MEGKIKTNNEQNIALQKLFLEKGYTFLNGRTEPFIRDDLDYFYFDDTKVISLGCKNSTHTNGNPFNFKTWDGETHFKKKKVKEYDPSFFI